MMFGMRFVLVALSVVLLAACGTTGGSTGGSGTGGGFVGDVDDFYDALAQRESGGDPMAVNTFGYLGLYQMGEMAMMDADWYMEPPNDTPENDWNGAWLSAAQSNSVSSQMTYLINPDAQDVAVRRFHDRVWGYINAFGLVAREGDIVNGIAITRSGLIAACHLLGCSTVDEYLDNPGGGTPADAYGTTIEEYLSLFANYQTAY